MTEDKTTLTRRRAELVAQLSRPELTPVARMNLQGELTLVNAKIKALNSTEAARLKATADQRRVAGLAEFQANSVRARAGIVDEGAPVGVDDPAQAAAIDAWFMTVVQDSGVKSWRNSKGTLMIQYGDDVPAKWKMILQRLRDGLHAACRGDELPVIEAETAVKPRKSRKG